jgi:transcription elongation GreA/GreB family factor
MSATPPPPEFQELIDSKKFDALEGVWTRRMEVDADDLPLFFGVAAAVKKKGGGAAAVRLLRFLADYHDDAADDARIRVLLEIARMSPTDPEIRKDLAAALKARFGGHPAFPAAAAKFPVDGAADPSDSAGKIARWLRFHPDEIYFLPGRGAGRLTEMKPALDVMRLDIRGTKIPLSLVSAEKTLVPLPADHFLRRKVEDPQSLVTLAESEPSETLRQLLASFGGALTLQEVKDHLSGILPEERWTAFWTSARKHKQLLVAGSAKSARVSWSESAGAADDSVREAFEKATPAARIELARKHAKRSKDLARFMGEALAREAARVGAGEPALAWELSQAAARLTPEVPEAFPAASLLAADVRKALPEIRDHQAREKALEAVRESRSDWAEIYVEQIGREEDARLLTTLFSALGDRSADVSRKILRSPRSAPRAFVWLLDRMHAEGRAESTALFVALTDALRMDEFSGQRARLKEFFEPGGLGVALVRQAASEEEARELLHALDRVAGLEEHRRATVREALLMKFPELRAPAREYLYATAASIEARRQELLQLRQVELPANAQAMKTAKEHGDLRENFEYHSARQKHEYLSARIATISDELSRTRTLDPARVDASEVRVGTRVRVRAEGGTEREIVILGPWDSKPEESIYSYQSEFAQRLLGSRPGDRVNLADGQVEVVSIAPWA